MIWRLIIILVVERISIAGKDEVQGRRTREASHAAGEEVTEDEGGAE
ncbi:hypothetical protein [Pseudomonas poae]|nr:hypothetical protein [Pseudomonas poae]